jgi:putative hydrolase of the HAD superfamily
MKRTRQSLIFDLDDTLIHCNKYFIRVIKTFAEDMKRWFQQFSISDREIKEKQLEIDLETVQSHGFASHHFPQSLVETYIHFCKHFGRDSDKQEIAYLLKLGESVYDQQYEPYPHAKETLLQLKNEGHELFLYTGGDTHIQEMKIEQMGLRHFFGERIYIARHKTTEDLEAIVIANHLDRRNTWMIGNSLRTDVLPALRTGIHAIHIPAEKEWTFNIVEVDVEPQGAFLTISSIKDVPEAIRKYYDGNLPS